MLEITKELKSSLKDCNRKLMEKYQSGDEFTCSQLKELISRQAGDFFNLNKLTAEEVKEWRREKPVVGVDGSINKWGSNYPHYLILMQSLAKGTVNPQQEIRKQNFFTPLVDEIREKIEEKARRDKIGLKEAADSLSTAAMAALEVEAARESILEWEPELIMLDGSLIRYKAETNEAWEELVELALEKETILVGIIEEVGTCQLSLELEDKLPDKMKKMYDRELLFGVLDKGEMIKVKEKINFKPDLQTAFLRNSRDPGVIGIDMLKEQRDKLNFIADLIYTLTPKDGRGIPLWLDIVDEQVKITNKMMEALVDNYLDPELKKRLFYSKRKERVY